MTVTEATLKITGDTTELEQRLTECLRLAEQLQVVLIRVQGSAKAGSQAMAELADTIRTGLQPSA